MEQKVLYYSDELNDELAPSKLKPRKIDENFKYKKKFYMECMLTIFTKCFKYANKIGILKK